MALEIQMTREEFDALPPEEQRKVKANAVRDARRRGAPSSDDVAINFVKEVAKKEVKKKVQGEVINQVDNVIYPDAADSTDLITSGPTSFGNTGANVGPVADGGTYSEALGGEGNFGLGDALTYAAYIKQAYDAAKVLSSGGISGRKKGEFISDEAGKAVATYFGGPLASMGISAKDYVANSGKFKEFSESNDFIDDNFNIGKKVLGEIGSRVFSQHKTKKRQAAKEEQIWKAAQESAKGEDASPVAFEEYKRFLAQRTAGRAQEEQVEFHPDDPRGNWGSHGMFITFGPEWLTAYTEQERYEITRQLMEEGLLEGDYGSTMISGENREKAREIALGVKSADTTGIDINQHEIIGEIAPLPPQRGEEPIAPPVPETPAPQAEPPIGGLEDEAPIDPVEQQALIESGVILAPKPPEAAPVTPPPTEIPRAAPHPIEPPQPQAAIGGLEGQGGLLQASPGASLVNILGRPLTPEEEAELIKGVVASEGNIGGLGL